jgi:hypothetical protein
MKEVEYGLGTVRKVLELKEELMEMVSRMRMWSLKWLHWSDFLEQVL